ncbi:MAG: hypothetical protein JWO62_1156 [Acidimicrobiaceae bacterium]|nr:hypothetical protein [Acidimicrobiaceae bacterium]
MTIALPDADEGEGHDRLFGRMIAVGVVVALAFFAGLGYFAVTQRESLSGIKAAQNSNHQELGAIESLTSEIATVAVDTQTLLTNGKTSSAQSAAAAKKSSAAAEKIIAHVENQLSTIITSSGANRQLICSIAHDVQTLAPNVAVDPTVSRYCTL